MEGGGQGGARVPGADPADGQVALHAAALVRHAGVHGGACGRGDSSAAHQHPPGTGQVGGSTKICPNSYINYRCLGVPCPTLRAQHQQEEQIFFSLRTVSVLGSEHISHSTSRSRIRPPVRTGRALAPARLPRPLQKQRGKEKSRFGSPLGVLVRGGISARAASAEAAAEALAAHGRSREAEPLPGALFTSAVNSQLAAFVASGPTR